MSATATTVDLTDPRAIVEKLLRGRPLAMEDPYPLYRALRELAPRYEGEPGMLVLSRFSDISAALRHRSMSSAAALHSDPRYPSSAVLQFFGNSMLFTDGIADHKRLRNLVRQAFTRQTVQGLRESTHALSHELLDRCLEMSRFDYMDDFIERIPVAVICKMLGVPEADIETFAEWNFLITTVTGPDVSDERMAAADEAAEGLRGYLRELLDERRRKPGDDLISKLIEARDEGGAMSDEETVCMAGFLLAAGSDTTSGFLGTATLALTRHPDQLQRLRDERELMPGAIEELLRYDGPIHFGIIRTAVEDCEVGDIGIAAGTRVWTMFPGGNRDPALVDEPETLDIGREGVRHLGFAQGMHMCLGAMLARVESEAVLNAALDRLATIEVLQDPIPWVNHGNLRGLAHLEVEATAAAA